MIMRARRRSGSLALVCLMIASMLSSIVPIRAEAAVQVVDSVQINNMDSLTNVAGDTTGGTITANANPEYIKEGTGSKRWVLFKPDNTSGLADVYPKSGPQSDWADHSQLSFWAYSTKVRPEPNKPIRIRFYPKSNPSTSHYYYYHIPLDWTGWKKIEIPLATVMTQKVGTPAAWGSIDFMRFDPAPIGGVTADQGSILYMDDFRLDKTIDLETAAANLPSGQYEGEITVALTTITPDAAVWYQRVGTDSEFVAYTAPLVIAESTVLRVKSVLNGFDSPVAEYDYQILKQGQVGTVDADPPAGIYMEPLQVTLSTPTVGASVYYQVYGSGAEFTLYQGPLTINRSQKLTTKAMLNGAASEPVDHAYVIKPYPALADVASGEYVGRIDVTLVSATPDAVVLYKLNGQDDFVPYTGPIAISTSQTLITRSVLGETSGEDMTYTYNILTNAVKTISNTETFKGWTNTTAVGAPSPVKEGEFSGKWTDPGSAIYINDISASWGQYDQLEFWAYSGLATNNKIYIIIDTDIPATGYDYYIMPLTIDWTGWKKVSLSLSKFTKSTANTDFSNFRRMIIHPRWYATDPLPAPGTEMYFDHMALSKKMIDVSTPLVEKFALPGSTVQYSVTLQNKGSNDSSYEIMLDPERSFGSGYTATAPGVTEVVPAGGELEFNIQVQVPGTANVNDIKQAAVLIRSVQDGAEEEVTLKLTVAQWQPSQEAHPYVLLTQEQLDKALEKVEKYDWAQDYAAAVVQKADEWVERTMVVPDKPGGHAIWYYCGDTPLIYDYDKPHEHVCPDDGKIYSGGDYDFAWRGQTHRRNIDAVRHMALAYTFTNDERYAEKAKDVLVEYAKYYPSYPVQTRYGRLFWQTLDEAVQIIKLAQAYDILYNTGLFTDDEKFNIEFNLFKQSAETLKGYDMTISNWQTWHNAAIGVIGVLLHDDDLIDYSLNGKSGFHYQMENSVLSDGFWWEGAINYHFYSQQALIIHAEALKHAGIDIFSDPTLKRTFDVSLEYAFPDLGIINNNDSNNYPTNLAGGPNAAVALDYEALYAQYKDPAYGALLSRIYGELGRPRGGFNSPDNPFIINGEHAVLYGEETIDGSGSLPSESKNFEGIGHAVLRSGTGEDESFALVDYGLHGASHGNFDKLHLEIFGQGERLAPDPGVTSTYGVSLYQEYYKKTLSHNTVVVDRKDQAIQKTGTQETFDSTRLFLDSPSFKITSNSAGKVYPELNRYERTVAMTPDYILDVFSVGSETPHTYDWVLHGMGEFEAGQEMAPLSGSIGSGFGYQYFRDGQQTELSGTGDSRWVTENGNGLRWISVNETASTLYAGELPGPASSQDYATAVINRVTGTEAQFVSIVEPFSGESKIAGVSRLSADRIAVELNDGRKQVLYYSENPVEGDVSYYVADGRGYESSEAAVDAVLSGNGETVQLEFAPPAGVERLTAVIYAPSAKQVTWNGDVVPHISNNGYVLVEIDVEDPAPAAALTVSAANIVAGDEVTVRYSLNVAQSVYAQDVTISYDSELFGYAAVEVVDENVAVLGVMEDTPGVLRILLAHTLGPIESGAPVLDITFTAKAQASGIGEFAVTSAAVADGVGTEFAAEVKDAVAVVGVDTNVTSLDAAIQAAQAIYEAAEAGGENGQYPVKAKERLASAIAAANVVLNDADVTPEEVVQAVAALNDAVSEFQGFVITPQTGDFNGNGHNVGDLALIAVRYGTHSGDQGWDARYDLDGDGEIGLFELVFIAKRILQ